MKRERTAATGSGPLPPGTLLQIAYLRERLQLLRPGVFFEVGVGQGHVSRTLLESGWSGSACDLNAETVAGARANLATYIAAGSFDATVSDWLAEAEGGQVVDLVVSSMVLEHLDDDQETTYLNRCGASLRRGGRIILIVPGSPRHWGAEDDIAGHMRRYTRETLSSRLEDAGWSVEHLAGLTYPLSNLLLPISNALVEKAEGHLAEESFEDRTRASGNRDVGMKTSYPRALRFLLNERAMRPLHYVQKRFRDSPSAMVLYAEATPRKAPR